MARIGRVCAICSVAVLLFITLYVFNFTLLKNRNIFLQKDNISKSNGSNNTRHAFQNTTLLLINRCSRCSNSRDEPTSIKAHFDYFDADFTIAKGPMVSWTHPSKIGRFCDDNIIIYDNRFGILHNVIMFPDRRLGKESQAKGGEEIVDIPNQGLNKEEYTFSKGFWEMNCTDQNKVTINQGTLKWLSVLKFNKAINGPELQNITNDMYVRKTTIAIAREDYANLWSWSVCVFNVFTMMLQFHIQPDDMSVLFLDGHPLTSLDKTWTVLFGPFIRVGHLTKPVIYKNLVWSLREGDGPIVDFRLKENGYTEEFRSFILQRHAVNIHSNLNCQELKITVIIRRDAVYHPRKMKGNVERKIFNEAELIEGLMEVFPNACVQGVLLESLPMTTQLEISSQTDLLIGMHGAGMTHTWFLPKHAAVLELFKKDFKIGRPYFALFQGIARWRNLIYESWENFDQSKEMPYDFTILPIEVILEKAKVLVKSMCPVL